MSSENWENYKTSVKDYRSLTDRYDLRFEFIDGTIYLHDGTPVILLGGVAPEGTRPEAPLVVISNVTEEEVKQLTACITALRSGKGKEDDQSAQDHDVS